MCVCDELPDVRAQALFGRCRKGMSMEEMLINYETYKEFKEELDGELQKTAEGFVRIGYLLKVARDTNILEKSGYKTVTEFAEAEYNLDKTQVSRFISINDRFSEGGYSDHLLPEFKGYGYAKLTIMLQIPVEIAEELSPEYSKAEIQTVREEIAAERQVSDIEVAIEGQRKDQADMNTLERTIHQLGEDQPDIYKEIYEYYSGAGISGINIRSIMAPSGEKIYSVRIMGQGRVMLTLKDQEERVTVTSVRTLEKETYTWEDVAEVWCNLMDPDTDTAEESWEKVYGKEFPGKAEKPQVAPVQRQEQSSSHTEAKKETKKKSKVVKAKIPETTSTEPAQAAVEEAEEQLPGQMNVEDYEGIVPEAKFEEIREAKHGETDGVDQESDNDGMSDRAGDANGAGEPAGSEIQSADAGAGAAEGGGRQTDTADVAAVDQKEEIWQEIYEKQDKLAKSLDTWRKYHNLMEPEQIVVLYHLAIAMAAGFEQLMGMMGWKEQESEE